MNIQLHTITVKELSDGYKDNAEQGVIGYGGKLDIRPPYQREFIYKDKQRDAVINTITKGFPLNVMYWAVRQDGNFEVIDGQQRTISICQYMQGDFSFNGLYYHNLPDDKQEQLNNYELMVYVCSGTDSEKLEWFRTINIAGEKLTDQELRNAVYAGSWLSSAKRYFSKTGCAAYQIGHDYLNGSAIRQEYLETAIDWISEGNIEDYMGKHQHDTDATVLWEYFEKVIDWVNTLPRNKKIMKGVDWGNLYNTYNTAEINKQEFEQEISKLILDDDVTKKIGIYPFLFTRNEKHLSIRAFTDSVKLKVYEKQKGICTVCKEHFAFDAMEADHITPWHDGGKTIEENCQMLCKDCNRRKSGK
ncbi:MAG: DUF262 domain-containing protein [Bacteriodetes bacterium]|nr:DUF262 domain-containing protein [Bacteroidota bacterium]